MTIENGRSKKIFEIQIFDLNSSNFAFLLLCRAVEYPYKTIFISHISDFLEIILRNQDKIQAGGVVHSFDGTEAERDRILNETEVNFTFYHFIEVYPRGKAKLRL